MPVAAEVLAFEAEVSGDQDFVVLGYVQDRGIVADPDDDGMSF